MKRERFFTVFLFFWATVQGAVLKDVDAENSESMADKTVMKTLDKDLDQVSDPDLPNAKKPSMNYDKSQDKHVAINNEEDSHRVVLQNEKSENLIVSKGEQPDVEEIKVKTVKIAILPTGEKIENVVHEGTVSCRNETNTTTCIEMYIKAESSGILGFGTLLDVILIALPVILLAFKFEEV